MMKQTTSLAVLLEGFEEPFVELHILQWRGDPQE